MNNRTYIMLSFCIVLFFLIISVLKEEKVFSGKVISSECVITGKSQFSVELIILSKEHAKGRFTFGVKKHP